MRDKNSRGATPNIIKVVYTCHTVRKTETSRNSGRTTLHSKSDLPWNFAQRFSSWRRWVSPRMMPHTQQEATLQWCNRKMMTSRRASSWSQLWLSLARLRNLLGRYWMHKERGIPRRASLGQILGQRKWWRLSSGTAFSVKHGFAGKYRVLDWLYSQDRIQ